MRIITLNVILFVLVLTSFTHAQSGPNVTLQLPSFKSTGVNTTVLVPDRGSSPLAAERQAFYGRSMYGPRRQSPLGSAQVATGTHVTAQVHDFRAAEAELLRSARERRATWQRADWQRGSLAGRTLVAESISEARPLSIAEIRRRQSVSASADEAEAVRLLAEARRARAQGKSGAAAVYYQMAARRASATERVAIAAEAARAD